MALSGPFTGLPRPPRQTGEWSVDVREMLRWFDRIWLILSGLPGIAWSVVSKAGSRLDDLESRSHNQLQSVLQADVSLEDNSLEKHITNELAFAWDRNKVYTAAITADAAALAGQHLTVTCSTADITVTLPDPAANTGMPVWIHKADATGYRVRTSVKDLKFQGSTMHLISNGTAWIIS